MGEYADAYFRQEVMEEFGLDPGSMYDEGPRKPRTKHYCPKCGKILRTSQGMRDHLRDKHATAAKETP